MDEFGGFESMPEVGVLTDAYPRLGSCGTRFGGVTENPEQQPGAFLTIEHATVSEHAEPAKIAGPSTMVAVGSILVMGAPSLRGLGRREEVRLHRSDKAVSPSVADPLPASARSGHLVWGTSTRRHRRSLGPR